MRCGFHAIEPNNPIKEFPLFGVDRQLGGSGALVRPGRRGQDHHREADAIQRARRKGAKPRPVAPRASLLSAEQNAVKLFRNAKQSVVYITSIVLAADPKMEDAQQEPAQALYGMTRAMW